MMFSRISRVACVAVVFTLLSLAPSPSQDTIPAWPDVSQRRLLNAQNDDGWLMYRRTYDDHAYAPFKQINTENVSGLRLVFSFPTGMRTGHEAPPIVNGHYMFITAPRSHLWALDATSGRVLWKYSRDVEGAGFQPVCCDFVNRGVALLRRAVFLGTIDAHLIAFDAVSGRIRWDQKVAEYADGYSITSAPLTVGDEVIVGVSGGEYGIRGFIAAYDAGTGKELWKHFTVPRKGEPGSETWPDGGAEHGGGPAWVTGSYDPATNTLFWGVGNPGPWNPDGRPGRNLFTDSVLALDASSGGMKWYFQFTPHDAWDYDGVNEDVLFDLRRNGRVIKALFHADRNGQFVVLDRETGRLIYSTPFAKALSILGYRRDGTAIVNAAALPTTERDAFTCPSAVGAKNWWPTSFDPNAGLAFIPVVHMCETISEFSPHYEVGMPYMGLRYNLVPEPGQTGFGELEALNVSNGHKLWGTMSQAPWSDGTLVTGGGVVFSAPADQTFDAYDERTGRRLWQYHTSSAVIGVPVSYVVDGKQYVAVLAGWGGGMSLYGGAASSSLKDIPRVGTLYVFSLP